MAGRPSLKTDDTLATICNRIADGESLRAICADPAMPGRQTVLDWLEVDEDFRAKYARAREAQADVMDDRILEVADATTPENSPAARIKIDAYKWRASKLKPKVYGDKLGLVGGDGQGPVQVQPVQVAFVAPRLIGSEGNGE